MSRSASGSEEAALNLADALRITDRVLEAEKAAEAALVFPSAPLPLLDVTHVDVKPRPITAPRLPFDFCQFDKTVVVDSADKDAKRLAFESEVLDVFSFGVCIAYYKRWEHLGDVMLSNTTHLRKSYDEMTDDERISTGSVVLKSIVDDLENERNEKAIAASLVGVRALNRMAKRLEAACEAFIQEA